MYKRQALERANLDADFLEALVELYPTCEAFYFQNCGKLVLAEDVRSHQIGGSDRFIRFGVNVRFFNIEGTEDMLIDTVGMSTLFLQMCIRDSGSSILFPLRS